MKRVVVTGVGIRSPIGNSIAEMQASIVHQQSGIRRMEDWNDVHDLRTKLGAPVANFDIASFPRKRIRGMGRVGVLALAATDDAIADAGLSTEMLVSGRLGLAYGSTHGSSSALAQFTKTLADTGSLRGLEGSAYLKFMSHTCAGNIAQALQIRGRVIPTVAACVSASQGIGMGYDVVRHGQQEIMLCGGAEELHYLHAAVFDIMFATSTADAATTPRPFDAHRDGLVVGEGAGTLVLESLDHAVARGAKIYGEIVGYGTCCDGTHITSPSVEGMANVMRLSLTDAGLQPSDINYINAHGTATDIGDVCESTATLEVMGDQIPFSSTKGLTGHTLGACGAIESAICLGIFDSDLLPMNTHLDEVDPRCAPLNYIRNESLRVQSDRVMCNNFAFGGINTSLIFQRLDV